MEAMQVLNPRIFREYDIRGMVGEDLDEARVRELGLGIGTYVRQKGAKQVCLGRDNRLSSEGFSRAIATGLAETGCEVIDVGMVPTPLLYFSLHHFGIDSGVMITGSHNPPEFNGFKVCCEKRSLFGEEIQQIRLLIEKGSFSHGTAGCHSRDVIEPYISFIKKKIRLSRPVRAVVDCGNGTAGPVATRLLIEAGCQIDELFCEPDGTYPNHHPDPIILENLKDLIARVKDSGAELGIAYDGDADRLGVVDEQGGIIWGDQLLIIFARDLLQRRQKAKVVAEVKCSQNLFDDIKLHGGQPIMWKAGHSLIKDKMRTEGAPLGGEMSGHFFFADDYFGYDDAIYASLRFLDIAARYKGKVSAMLADLPKRYSTPEIRVDCPDEEKFGVVKKIRTLFARRHPVIDVDGARISFDEGWALVRASNTQPALVLRFEASSAEKLEEIKTIVTAELKKLTAKR